MWYTKKPSEWFIKPSYTSLYHNIEWRDSPGSGQSQPQPQAFRHWIWSSYYYFHLPASFRSFSAGNDDFPAGSYQKSTKSGTWIIVLGSILNAWIVVRDEQVSDDNGIPKSIRLHFLTWCLTQIWRQTRIFPKQLIYNFICYVSHNDLHINKKSDEITSYTMNQFLHFFL